MAQKNELVNGAFGKEIIISRIINAPQALVFNVWTAPKHIGKWWGPNGFTITTHEIDLRVGGVWRFIMHGPDGTDYPSRITYKEISAPNKIAYDHDSDVDNDPGMFSVVISFEPLGDKTKLTLHSTFASEEVVKMVVEQFHAIEGGNQTISRFESQLADVYANVDKEKEFTVSREFNAPLAAVYKALSTADALAQWWGPKGMKMKDVKLDFRPGGTFHYGMAAENGFVMWGKFVYQEIIPMQRIVFVNSFSDEAGGTTRAPFFDGKWPLEVLNILTLSENNGKTTISLRGWPINASAEEMKLFNDNRSSMDGGFNGTFDQLDIYLSNNK